MSFNHTDQLSTFPYQVRALPGRNVLAADVTIFGEEVLSERCSASGLTNPRFCVPNEFISLVIAAEQAAGVPCELSLSFVNSRGATVELLVPMAIWSLETGQSRTDTEGIDILTDMQFDWSDIVTLMGQVPQWRDNYYAFLPLESDCTPLRPGWISELCEEFRLAQAKNYAAVGHIHENPTLHLNGVAIYDSNLWKIVGGNKLNGSDPQVAYDIYHRNNILPYAYDTPLIMMEYQRPTITAEDLFKPWKNGFEPAMFHGVKDGSARAAVRAKYVTFSENRDISKITVFTYEHQRPNNPSITAKYDLWYDAWKSRGWNPIKLSLRDAVRNPKYTAVQKNLEKLPTPLAAVDAVSRVVRWIALDSVGGGFMVDPEVLPNTFFPENLNRTNRVLCSKEAYFGVQAACLNREALTAFSEAVRKYSFNPDTPILDPEREFLTASGVQIDAEDILSIYGQNNWRSGSLVTFSQSEMQRIGARGTTIQVMEKFLRET